MSQIFALTAILSKVMMKTMAKKKFAYKYLITYEVVEIPDAPNVKERISVRRVQYATDGRIREKHHMETVELWISLQAERGRPVQIVHMQPLWTREKQEGQMKGETGEG